MAEELREQESSQNPAIGEDSNQERVKLTPRALETVKAMLAREKLGPEMGLRIGVTGGGCSGFQYALNFDSRKQGDIVTVLDGVRIFVDEVSLPYLAGTTLDYVEGLHNGGFRFDNPRATRTCGCGSSFSA
jgi:iron-sulfur cluster assembly accessory protein